MVQTVSARTGYGFFTSFLGLDRCVKKVLRAMASHVIAFGTMLERAGNTVPSITNGEAAEPLETVEAETGLVCMGSDPTAAGHADDTDKQSPMVVTGIPDTAAKNAPATSPTDTAPNGTAPVDATRYATVPGTSCADTSSKGISTTAPHVKRTSTPRHPGTPRKAADSKSRTPTPSPSDSVSSKSPPGSASPESVTSASDSDSPERRPKKVGFDEPLDSRRSTHTTLEKSNFDAAPRQPSSDAPRYNQSFFSFLSELFENEPPRPNRSEPYGPFCHAPSMSEANSSGTTSTTYAHAKATYEAEYKAHTLAWYASLVPDDYDPNDPSKHWMLHPDLRGILETQDLNYSRAREYLPTIEELRAFRKVYQAILAAGDRISIMEQLGRSSDLIGKAYVAIKIL